MSASNGGLNLCDSGIPEFLGSVRTFSCVWHMEPGGEGKAQQR